MAYLGTGNAILPASTVTDVTGPIFDVLGANAVPILGVLGVMLGIKLTLRALNKGSKGKVGV